MKEEEDTNNFIWCFVDQNLDHFLYAGVANCISKTLETPFIDPKLLAKGYLKK